MPRTLLSEKSGTKLELETRSLVSSRDLAAKAN
jgi:hypothetical protein